MKITVLIVAFCASLFSSAVEPGSVIFLHPDGTGLGHWNAARLLAVGPDGDLNWDRMDRLAAYRVHQKGWLSTTSHAGATVHAYGKKVVRDSYGMDGQTPLQAVSGKDWSIMREAMEAGIRCGIVNSGHIGEPGTGVFLASSLTRRDVTGIAKTILESGADVIFTAGEVFLLPEGMTGVHGEEGRRTDGLNLLEAAKERGYTVIFTREELLALPADVEKVVGIFAAVNTYNSISEADLAERGLQAYEPGTPTVAEMTAAALKVLSSDPDRRFFLMTEEEGTDNFSNATNASGMLEATMRADQAIGEALAFQEAHPDRPVLVLVGSDSDAGHPLVWAPYQLSPKNPLPPKTETGADLDGVDGTGTLPFLSKADAFGNRYAFGIAWPTSHDAQGATVAKAHGYRSGLLPVNLDNTGIYPILYQVLFGTEE